MTQLRECVAGLQIVLGAEEDVYRRLKALLQREEEELVQLDPNDLERTTAEKRALMSEARLHEESRNALVISLARILGLEEDRPRLSTLIRELGDDAGDLVERHARLSALLSTTRTLVSANERFANRSLTRVRDTLRLLGHAVPEEVGYGPAAARSRRTGRGRLVRAAI